MSQTIEAIYEDGLFKPLAPVSLPDGTRVRVEVEPSTDEHFEPIKQQLLSEGYSPEAIDKSLATIRQLHQGFEGLTDRLDQIVRFTRAMLWYSYE